MCQNFFSLDINLLRRAGAIVNDKLQDIMII